MHAAEHFADFTTALVTAYEWPESLASRVAAAIGDRPQVLDGEIVVSLDGTIYTVALSLYETYAQP